MSEVRPKPTALLSIEEEETFRRRDQENMASE